MGVRAEDQILDSLDRQLETARRAYENALQAYNDLAADAGDAVVDKAIRNIDRTSAALQGISNAAPGIRNDAAALRDYFQSLAQVDANQQSAITLAQDARQAFAGIFTQAAQGAQSFGDVLNNVVQRLKAVAIEALLIQPILNALFGRRGQGGGLFGGLFEGLTGGGGFLGGIGDFFGLSPGARSAAGPRLGGRSTITQPNLVFAPTIQSTDGPGVQAALARALPQFTAAAQQAFIQGVSRPGQLRQAFRGA